MLQIVETEGKVNGKGCIEIPAVVFQETGISIGESIKLIYLSEKDSLKNESKEFLLLRAEQNPEELLKEENITFQVPLELLADAGIPLDADLDIVCREQKIVILPAQEISEIKVPEELLQLCKEFGISEEKVQVILRSEEKG